MKELHRITRRTVLRGMGTAMALPLLDAMLPRTLRAATPAAAAAAPRRMAFVFVPNGIHMPDWRPAEPGPLGSLPPILQPLESLRSQLLVLTNLTHDKARPNGDGPGDHARSAAAFLTASQPRKTAGADIHVGISVDQFAAQQIGDATRFASLELGIDRGANAGNCDSGYSCAYSSNISWRSPNTPNGKEVNPRAVFDRLFGDHGAAASDQQRAKEDAYRRSILDLVLEDARSLKRQLGSGDQRKLDEYLDSVRELESRIQSYEQRGRTLPDPEIARPDGIPKDLGEHLRLMFDLLALAFQTDQTRIATFMVANEGSNRAYPQIGVSQGHHDLSHHGNDREKQEKISKINRYHMEYFARFLQRLQSTPEGDGTLLDHSMIVYGCAISDGNRHNHDDLPVLLAGRAGGAIRPGRHVTYPRNTPMANLFVSMLQIMGVPAEAFGDSTGALTDLG
jgi:hypothetical protein